MKDALLKLSIKIQDLAEGLRDRLKDEQGQDLIEYALVVGLIAFGAAATMGTLAQDINNAFTGIGATLASYVA